MPSPKPGADRPPELPSAKAPRPDDATFAHATRAQRLVLRNPITGRRASVAAIGAGAAVFVAVGLTAPLAGAGTDAAGTTARRASDHARHERDLLAGHAPATSRGTTSAAGDAPKQAAHQSPVDHGSISALTASGIPKVALNAYRVAAARLADAVPSCGIDWALLAGIGREESNHGQFAGAVLHTDGTSTPRIIGPALDGKKWERIPAPANGLALDGDAKYAHALGPMQFIPTTWDSYGADADGDGTADVFDINDAALGAARYLCAAGGDLRTRAGQDRAVHAYNRNDRYRVQVLALANAYRKGIPITGLPVGITKGRLPKTPHHGRIPPADPGGPATAADDRPATSSNGRAGTAPRSSTSRPHSTSARPSTTKPTHASSKPTSTPTPCATTTGTTTPPATSTPTPTPTPTCTTPSSTKSSTTHRNSVTAPSASGS